MAYEAYHSNEYYQQYRNMLLNGDPRALICFCIDVSKSMGEYWIQEGGLTRTSGSGHSDGHTIQYFNVRDIRPGYEYYVKIDKLNEVLGSLLRDFMRDPDIRDKVAISIVVYSQYGRVLMDFLDCSQLNLSKCRCEVEVEATAMGDGLRTALAQIDEMENDMRHVGKDAYTPLLIFMTDGTPTDNPSAEFARVRERVQQGELHVFPLGIGNSADMSRLRNLFPDRQIPLNFSNRYKMVHPRDYVEIFQEIKRHVSQRQSVMVSEGDSVQSAPAIVDDNVFNNQMGESLIASDLLALFG